VANRTKVKRIQPPTLSTDRPFSQIVGLEATTIPALFLQRCSATPDRVAFRVKELGIYREVTWQEYQNRVEKFSLGLSTLGLKRGDRVAIIGAPSPHWMYADLATQCAGAISYGIDPKSSLPEVKHLLGSGGARFVVALDEEWVKRIQAEVHLFPQLQRVIVANAKGNSIDRNNLLINYEEIEEQGLQQKIKASELLKRMVSEVKSTDIATIIYRSLSAGAPNGTMISHHDFMYQHFSEIKGKPEVFLEEEQRSVCYLPFTRLVSRLHEVYVPILTGKYITHFGAGVETIAETIVEISPTIFIGTPRTYKQIASQVIAGMETSTRIKKGAYRWAMAIGQRHTKKRKEQRNIPWHLKLVYLLAYWTVFRLILDKIGLARARFAFVTSGPELPEVVESWQVWGVNLCELRDPTQ